jgi:hypothetical protein
LEVATRRILACNTRLAKERRRLRGAKVKMHVKKILYLKGSPSNLSKARAVLDLFCLASGAKINWGKSAAIWASKDKKEWEWGQEVGLKWISRVKGFDT